MPGLTAADTIRILVATDNHVGYAERDPVRGDDSWKSFHEIMCMAKDRDVDMVLLAGDLFHDNNPSRKSMYNVMRSIRMNCLGPKPCELECLSDGSEHFDGTFGLANYEDPNLNVAIPVFSIHGNHDDPTGEGHFAALDILGVSGLLNYFGRTPESDRIIVRSFLLQKGRTKLALYGMSNVRDERLHRTFQNDKVKFLRPNIQTEDWFNLCCVHQNHAAHTETSYLPEHRLPDFLDLVIWGHEHECLIQPSYNPEKNFRVIQPGSSVATSLVAAEAVPKQVCILSITGREFKSEPIRLKTVRPFVFKDIALSDFREVNRIAKKEDHRAELTRFLIGIVEELIDQAKAAWREAQDNEPPPSSAEGDDQQQPQDNCPLPLIRLRVENTPPDGIAKFDCENPQRFSNRFMNKVANTTDVIHYYTRKKSAVARRGEAAREADAAEDKEILARVLAGNRSIQFDTIKVEMFVEEFLKRQSLTILPQNSFGDAVGQFIDKDDKHAMEVFVNESLSHQIKHLVNLHKDSRNGADDEDEEQDLGQQIAVYRSQLEELFAKGLIKRSGKGTANVKPRYKPKPDEWDSDEDGSWEDNPLALIRTSRNETDDLNFDDDEDGTPVSSRRGSTSRPSATTARGRGARGRASRGGRTTASTRGRGSAAPKKSTTSTSIRGRKKASAFLSDEDEDEGDDVVMLDDEDDDDIMIDDDNEESDSQALFVSEPKSKSKATSRSNGTATSTRSRKAAATTTAASKATSSARKTPARSTPATASKTKQGTLSFAQSQRGGAKTVGDDISDDDDDDDAFEPVSTGRSRR